MELCFYECGRQATTDDHIIVAAIGGADCPENYVRACEKCNHDRGSLPIEEYLKQIGVDKPAPKGLTELERLLRHYPVEQLTIVVCDHCSKPAVYLREGIKRHRYRFCNVRHRHRFYRKLRKTPNYA